MTAAAVRSVRPSPTPIAALASWLADLAAHAALGPTPTEDVDVARAIGRVAAVDVESRWPSPRVDVAAMDGYACRAGATDGGRVGIGGFSRIDTGDALLLGCDRVVAIEDAALVDGALALATPCEPGQHVRRAGEDIEAGAVLVRAGRELTPYDAACVAVGGHARVAVRARPRVAIVPTGDELVAPGVPPAPGAVTESNGLMLAGAASSLGATATLAAPVADAPAAIAEALLTVQADLVLLLAGTSRGRDDHAAAVLSELGVVTTHGVAARPGHPVVLARIGTTAVIGVPGYPLSAACTFQRFALPLLARLTGRAVPARLRCVLAADVTARPGAETTVPVRLVRTPDGHVRAVPLPRRAAATRGLATADALLVMPSGTLRLGAGSVVEVELLAGAGGWPPAPADR